MKYILMIFFLTVSTKGYSDKSSDSKVNELYDKMIKQEEINTMLSVKLDKLETKNIELETTIKVHNNFLLAQYNDMKMHVSKIDARLSNEDEQLHHLKDQFRRNIQMQNNVSVSFTVYATQTRTFNEGEIVVFDGIINNNGNGYDPETSIFTCPEDGYYLFILNTHSTSAEYVEVEMQLDGEILVASSASDDDDSSSTSVVTLCNTAQQVWVVAQFDGQSMFGHDDLRYSSFSGALLSHA